jgi:hypothetical protein
MKIKKKEMKFTFLCLMSTARTTEFFYIHIYNFKNRIMEKNGCKFRHIYIHMKWMSRTAPSVHSIDEKFRNSDRSF